MESVVASENPDIIAITETWLTADVFDYEISLADYTAFRQDRCGNRKGGGVILYFRKFLHAILFLREGSSGGVVEHNWCKCHIAIAPVVTVGCLYRSPGSPGDYVLDAIRQVGNHPRSIILGDFNAPDIDWNRWHVNASDVSFDAKLFDSALVRRVQPLLNFLEKSSSEY